MALNPLANVLQYPQPDPEKLPPPIEVLLGGKENRVSFEDGAKKTELDDGGAIIDLDPKSSDKPKSDKFDANLALDMEDTELNKIASDLIRGFNLDVDSRAEQLVTIAEGIKLLGLVIEQGATNTASSSSVTESQHKTHHPLLLDACLLFQANARGQLLPAAGPVKIRDDQTQPPDQIGIGHNGGPPLDGMPMPPAAAPPPMAAPGAMGTPPAPPPMMGPPGAMPPGGAPMGAGPMPGMPPMGMMAEPPKTDRDNLATALEKDFNHYLTVTAKEYVPDTDQMLFKVGFGGLGIKKVYNCPIRRRPVAESIDIEDFVVSNALTDLGSAGRITHRTKMRPSTLRRLQILGFYRDFPLTTPSQADQPNAVDQAKADVAGVQPQVQDPKDADYVILEMLCELELDQFAPKKFKGKSLPLPYRVTIEKDSQKVLEIRRNWREDDPECLAKEYYVEYVFVRAFGFYGLGLLHILGNTTKTLTAAWREFIDSGMFANFPGFLYAKGAGRQLTNQFRVAPGQGVGLDIGLQKMSDAVMPLPYKDLGPAFTAFIQHVEELGQRLGGTSQINVGEGRQDAPVGTTLALIEQATKPTGAVMKRLHDAQSKEFQLIKERFQEDPEAFWRFNRKPAMKWQKDQFLEALEDFDLIPVADPNNPTSLHRAAKAQWLKEVAMAAPGLLDTKKVYLKSAKFYEISDAEDLLAPPMPPGPPPGPPPDPAKMADVALKGHKLEVDQQTAAQKAALDQATQQAQLANSAEERASKERIAMLGLQTERLRLASTLAIHSNEQETAQRALHLKIAGDELTQMRGHVSDHVSSAAERRHAADQAEVQRQHDASEAESERKHQAELATRAAKAKSKAAS